MKKKASELVSGEYLLIDNDYYEKIIEINIDGDGVYIRTISRKTPSIVNIIEEYFDNEIDYLEATKTKLCAFFENRVCDEGCMSLAPNLMKNGDTKQTFYCIRLSALHKDLMGD